MSNGVPNTLVYSQLFFYGFGHVLASMAHGVFGTGSCFRVGWHTAGGCWFLFFGGFLLVLGEAFILGGVLGYGLSFRGVWAISWYFLIA